jgi:hypothetical protein
MRNTMAPSTILVLGATGPAGLCVVREALFRQHPTIAYVRNAGKFPEDLRKNPLLGGDALSWEKDRQDATFAGSLGVKGWTYYVKRGGLAKWLVDQAEQDGSGAPGSVPAATHAHIKCCLFSL